MASLPARRPAAVGCLGSVQAISSSELPLPLPTRPGHTAAASAASAAAALGGMQLPRQQQWWLGRLHQPAPCYRCARTLRLHTYSGPAHASLPGSVQTGPEARHHHRRGPLHLRRAIDGLLQSPTLLQLCFWEKRDQHSKCGDISFETLASALKRVLEGWAERWSDSRVMCTALLNKTGILKEIEESLLPLREVLRHLSQLHELSKSARARGTPQPRPAVLVDLCSGKGYFPLLLSYLLAEPRWQHLRPWLHKCVLIDQNTKINFDHHIHGLQPDLAVGHAAVSLETWIGINLHDEQTESRLAGLAKEHQVLLVGIHLCRRLSARAVYLFNWLGPLQTGLFVLAPCCLPPFHGAILFPIRRAWVDNDERNELSAANTASILSRRREVYRAMSTRQMPSWHSCQLRFPKDDSNDLGRFYTKLDVSELKGLKWADAYAAWVAALARNLHCWHWESEIPLESGANAHGSIVGPLLEPKSEVLAHRCSCYILARGPTNVLEQINE